MGEAIRVAAHAVKLRALDVPRRVQTLETDEEDGGRGLGVREFLVQRGGLDGLGVGPRIARILCMREREEKRNCKKTKRKASQNA